MLLLIQDFKEVLNFFSLKKKLWAAGVYFIIFFLFQSLHTKDHLGLWYKIEPEVLKQLYNLGGIPKKYAIQSKTFNETCLMVREPALTVIDLIKRSNLSLPPNKFLLCILFVLLQVQNIFFIISLWDTVGLVGYGRLVE